MILLKYILIGLSIALFGTAIGLVGYDVWIAFQLRRLLQRGVAEGEKASLPFEALRVLPANTLAGGS